jgi:hypothetical protein
MIIQNRSVMITCLNFDPTAGTIDCESAAAIVTNDGPIGETTGDETDAAADSEKREPEDGERAGNDDNGDGDGDDDDDDGDNCCQ